VDSRLRAGKRNLEYTFGLCLNADDRKVFDKDGAMILEAIEEYGSIVAAAKAVKMSYRFAWNYLIRMGKELDQPIVVTRRGGTSSAKKKGGGGTTLTPVAKVLLKEFTETERLMRQSLSKRKGPTVSSQVCSANR
jgi:molybdate transport system regulatory protein